MKRLYSLLLIAALAVTSFAADRAHTLKVYNWADYISEEVLEAFPEWYKSITGEDVEVVYQTFDINESMLTQIEIGKEDFDVICPSEYIIERMLKNDLLLPINKNLIPDSLRYFDNVAPFVVEKFRQMSETVDVSDYTVGYMWGTTGFLYNAALVDGETLQSWGALLNPAFENRIFVKDAFRDVYSVLVLYAYYDEIQAGTVTRDELVKNITPERIAAVENVLMAAKKNVAGWEVDFGKEEMTKGKAWINLSWSGDAAWAIDEAAEVGVDLRYVIPVEGTNVWFDGWCIPRYAKNTKAASYFINYMCRPDNAIKNMDEIGYVSVIATPEILEEIEDEEAWDEPLDLTYFFGEGADAVYANPVYYPDLSVIERSALMHDAGDEAEALIEMWNRVKGDNLSMGMIIFLCALIAIVAIYFIVRLVSGKKKNKKRK